MLDYYIVPQSTIADNTLTVWYEVKPNNEKKHLRMHDEDINYIHHWLSRFVMDVSAKQIINPSLYMDATCSTNDMPRAGYEGKDYNSIVSYASGIVGNRLRNPSEDYTKKQLQYISKLFNMICFAYSGAVFNDKDLGYNLVTKAYNDKPMKLKFKEVK
tara:strand:+ start:1507 stop:1980 length:474 start_codon:yes stop_codon:yes gene_type:complete